MKTKFKISTKLHKKNILKNNNFLNNQNYIINNKRKRKVFIKFINKKYKYIQENNINIITSSIILIMAI